MTFKKKGIYAIAISSNEPTNNAKYVIQGKIARMNIGNWSARFWLGMSIGAGRFGVSAKLMDVSSGSTIDDFSDYRSCDTWNGDDGILECGCIEISEDGVNKFMKKL